MLYCLFVVVAEEKGVIALLPQPGAARLPICNFEYGLTLAESTLLQVLIPLHLISFRINTYKKPRGRGPSASLQASQLVTSPQCDNFSPVLGQCDFNGFGFIKFAKLSWWDSLPSLSLLSAQQA